MRFLLITVKIALRALRRNPMRSLLTILGIIIGVAAVIAMIGIGRGASVSVQEKIASLGNNMLVILSGSTTQGGIGWPTIVSADAIILAWLFSSAVGIFFGFYPARKAAHLDPIQAMRYE